MGAFIKETLSRIPNWLYIVLIAFAAGFFTAVYSTGNQLLIDGKRYGVVEVDQINRIVVGTTSTNNAGDEKHGGEGRYFNFDGSELASLIAQADWKEVQLYGVNLRSGRDGLMTVWNGKNGGSTGTMHGRFSDWGSSNGQFQIGDRIELVTLFEANP